MRTLSMPTLVSFALAVTLGCGDGRALSRGTAAAQNKKADAPAPSAPTPQLLQPPSEPPFGRADAIVDLRTRAGTELVQAGWRYRDARLVKTQAHAAGADLRPSGAAIDALDLDVQASDAFAGGAGWQSIAPEALEARRGTSHVSFGWYALTLVLPQRIGDVDVAGSAIAFEIVVDDYAEVWVDGQLARTLGQRGGSLVAGFNAPNRVLLTRDARPGQRVQLAVLAINGPLSARPENFLWVRSATLDVYAPRARASAARSGKILRLDPALDAVIAKDAPIEKLATGFSFTEGPVWTAGALLFSDPNENTLYRYDPEGRISVLRTKSGYSGVDIARYRQPGSNGLAVDRDGRLTIDQHGNRRVVRVERTGALTVLADRYQGKRLNSPNDLVYKSDGSLYFTDPPFGLPRVYDDPAKELPFSGVFRVDPNGELTLLTRELAGPNGIAFSPDERFLYVGNWDLARKVVMRYPVQADGSLGAGKVFYDLTSVGGEEAIDGVKVDARGNVYVSGPGGVHVVSNTGKHLGTIVPDELPANFAFGDADGRTLYMTARTGLYRVRLNVAGSHPGT